MQTKYEIMNVHLARYFSKARKLEALYALGITGPLLSEIEKEILDGEEKEAIMERAEEEDRIHWIHYYGNMAAADLLCLGKVQPETMFAMSQLPTDDFKEVVKIATGTARMIDKHTVSAEKELNVNKVPDELT